MLKRIGFGTLLLFLAISGAFAQGYGTYGNFGMTFEYPRSWSVTETGSYSDGNVTLLSDDALLMIAFSENLPPFDTQVMLDMLVAMFQSKLSQSSQVVDKSGIIDGNPAYAKVLSFDAEEVPMTCIFVDFISSKSSRIVTMMFTTPSSDEQNLANFEHVLNTWRDLGTVLASSQSSPRNDVLQGWDTNISPSPTRDEALLGWGSNTGGAASATSNLADRISIDWSNLDTYFTISDVTIQKVQHTNALGHVSEIEAMTFIVVAKRNFLISPMFTVEFYDKDGFKIDTSMLFFEPDYSYYQWSAGDKSRGYIWPLKSSWDDVVSMKLRPLI